MPDTVEVPSAAANSAPPPADTGIRELAAKFISLLETGVAPDGLFTADVFTDFTMPLWRLQFQGAEATVAGRPTVRRFTGCGQPSEPARRCRVLRSRRRS